MSRPADFDEIKRAATRKVEAMSLAEICARGDELRAQLKAEWPTPLPYPWDPYGRVLSKLVWAEVPPAEAESLEVNHQGLGPARFGEIGAVIEARYLQYWPLAAENHVIYFARLRAG